MYKHDSKFYEIMSFRSCIFIFSKGPTAAGASLTTYVWASAERGHASANKLYFTNITIFPLFL